MPWDRKRLLGHVETIQLILAVSDKIVQQAQACFSRWFSSIRWKVIEYSYVSGQCFSGNN